MLDVGDGNLGGGAKERRRAESFVRECDESDD